MLLLSVRVSVMFTVFFFKQKTAYELRISDWSSDVCSSDLADNWFAAAHSIMTTDTLPKIVSRRVALGNATITLTGISKGAGMIRPNMATMLGYLATDAGIAPELLKDMTRAIADRSFNRITVRSAEHTSELQSLMRIP